MFGRNRYKLDYVDYLACLPYVDDDDDDDDDEEAEEDVYYGGYGVGTLLAIAGAAAVAVAVASRSSETPAQQSQAQARALHVSVVNARERVLPSADWYEDACGRLRWWDGRQWTEHVKSLGTSAFTRYSGVADQRDVAQSNEVGTANERMQTTMNRAEWQERARAMLLARTFSEAQRRLLSTVHIIDPDAELLRRQCELRSLNPQQFSKKIVAMLDQTPGQPRVAALLAPPGWYDDGGGSCRWWDGRQWTGHVHEDVSEALANTNASAPSGWFNDGHGNRRWWDGERWTDHVQEVKP